VDKGQEKVLKLHKVHCINESNIFIVRYDENSEKIDTDIFQGISSSNFSVRS